MKYLVRYGRFAPFGDSVVGKKTEPKALCLGFKCDGCAPGTALLGCS